MLPEPSGNIRPLEIQGLAPCFRRWSAGRPGGTVARPSREATRAPDDSRQPPARPRRRDHPSHRLPGGRLGRAPPPGGHRTGRPPGAHRAQGDGRARVPRPASGRGGHPGHAAGRGVEGRRGDRRRGHPLHLRTPHRPAGHGPGPALHPHDPEARLQPAGAGGGAGTTSRGRPAVGQGLRPPPGRGLPQTRLPPGHRRSSGRWTAPPGRRARRSRPRATWCGRRSSASA